MALDVLAGRLREAGFAVASITPATGGVVALAGLVTLADGRRIFAKTLAATAGDVFPVEAEGLRALAELGGANPPDVLLSTPDLHRCRAPSRTTMTTGAPWPPYGQ